ncbi:MAG TPA: NUDIX hydrolase [Streptosporangiaceae bacterium]|nr:NUDIX hydrolase [Streptosporangiaceae bacterium]
MADLPLSDRLGSALVSFEAAAGADLESPDDAAPMPLSLIVVVCAGRVLMVLDAARGQWELPGGTREEDETARQAAVRELAEETGITVADLEPAAVAGFDLTRPARREYAAVYRLMPPAIPQLAADDEILDFRWWDPRSPLPVDMSPLDAEIGRRVTGPELETDTNTHLPLTGRVSLVAVPSGGERLRADSVSDVPAETLYAIARGVSGRTSGHAAAARCAHNPSTRWRPRSTSFISDVGRWPTGSSRSALSRVTRAVMFTTESLGRPEAIAGRNTLPGIAARAVLDVMTAAMVVLSRLALNGSAWMTRTGRRLADLLPCASPRPAQQMLPRLVTSRPGLPGSGGRRR